MATVRLNPDTQKFALVDMTEDEFMAIYRALLAVPRDVDGEAVVGAMDAEFELVYE